MDPISDMFIRIKNAQKAGHVSVQISYSKFKHEIVKALERSGYVKEIEKRGKRIKKSLDVTLRYNGEIPAVQEIKFFSKPSRRLYTSYKQLFRAPHGGILILSTPKGVMTDKEARTNKVGGELIAEIW